MGYGLLFLILAVVILAIPVSIIALIIGHVNLRKRLTAAERKLLILQDDRLPKPEAEAPKPEPTPQPADPVISPPKEPEPKPAQPPAIPAKSPEPAISAPPRPTPVADAFARLGPWLQENWFYAISALSLALAGIFLVQYGMENGLLPPSARVAAALAFGVLLIGAGEWIRRRYGDDDNAITAYLPSVFTGAGLVTLFGGVVSARMLYDLIGPNAAMAGMVGVALLGLVLGWLYGPLMAAIGVIGAFAAPVVLGPSDADASPLYGYFAIVAVLGLGIDTIRRWAWVSALTLVLAYLVGWGLLYSPGYSIDTTSVFYFAALPLLAITIPARSILRPDQAGKMVVVAALKGVKGEPQKTTWPAFPTVLSFASLAASSGLLMTYFDRNEDAIWLSMIVLLALALVVIIWSWRATALQDQAVLPALALLGSIALQGINFSETVHTFHGAKDPVMALPFIASILIFFGVLITLAAAWRSRKDDQFKNLWAVLAAVYAPAVAILLEAFWYEPSQSLGAYTWALHAAALAALMVFLAERFGRRDGDDRLRAALFTMSALSCLAFAFVVIFSAAALTVALAVTVLVAAVLDRRFDLPLMTWFITVGVAVVGYRLVVNPGLEFGRLAPIADMLLAYAGAFIAFGASLRALSNRHRPMAKVLLDSALWSTGGMLLSLLLWRGIETFTSAYDLSHWGEGLTATIWLGLALAQLQRVPLGGRLRFLRLGLTAAFAFLGVLAMIVPLFVSNPLLTADERAVVVGPALFNTLIPAYLVPGLLLVVGGWRLSKLSQSLRLTLFISGGALCAFWLVMAVRHFWNGAKGMPLPEGFAQGELYTYTVALLLIGGGLFYQSLAGGFAKMRKAGLVVIGLAVAKVFLVDISGLTGLMRVFSLLILGLSLAGLAWLNRWAVDRNREQSDET